MDSAEKLAAKEARRAALGRHLRALRTGNGYTQPILAELAGVSVATIRAIENHHAGKQHTERILKKLSQGLGKPDDYLKNYLQDPPPGEEPAGRSEATGNAPPPRSPLDLVVPRLDEIVVARLNEIVVPRLDNMENQVRALKDVIYNTGRGVEIDVRHAGEAE